MALPTITAFDWVPDVARGQVRDLRVRWALEEVGQPYAVRYLSQGEQKQPAHRALQPYGQVPTFEDGTLTLFESGAIVLHVAERGALLPDDAAGRAHALEWSFAALNSVEPPIMDHAIATLFEADAPWSAPRLPAIEQRIRERLFDTARRLGDLLMIAVLRILRDDPLLAEQPTLLAYVERGEARPAFARALADQMAGITGSPPPEIVAWLEQRQQREEIRR